MSAAPLRHVSGAWSERIKLLISSRFISPFWRQRRRRRLYEVMTLMKRLARTKPVEGHAPSQAVVAARVVAGGSLVDEVAKGEGVAMGEGVARRQRVAMGEASGSARRKGRWARRGGVAQVHAHGAAAAPGWTCSSPRGGGGWRAVVRSSQRWHRW